MKLGTKVAAVLAAVAVSYAASAIEVLDFEGQSGYLQGTGYGGMGWNANAYAYSGTSGGYGVIGTQVLINAFEATYIDFWTLGDNFDVYELDMIAAWYTEVTYRLDGWRDGGVVHSYDAVLDCFNVRTMTINFTNIDAFSFTFVSSNYVEGYPGQGSGAHFAADNIKLVPAPAALSLLGLGVLGLRRRRR
jgi:hypothetical protein